jgi:hypothetical protein
MLMFITPLVSKRYASDWERTSNHFAITLSSLHQQTNPDWKLMLIGSHLPDLPAALKEKVVFIEADLDIDTPGMRGRHENDKCRKLYRGFCELHHLAPEFIMVLDHDDLISTRLVEDVMQHADIDGHILTKGYVYNEGHTYCRYSRRIDFRTDSNFVVRYRNELFPTETTQFNPPPKGYWNWPFVECHKKKCDRLLDSLGMSHRKIPFPSVIYRRYASSLSRAYNQSQPDTDPHRVQLTAKQRYHDAIDVIKDRMLRRKISPKLIREFGCDPEVGFDTLKNDTA